MKFMAEFESAKDRIHMEAVPYILTRDLPAAKNTTIIGSQHAVKIAITIASVNATRRSILELTTTVGGALSSFFLRFSLTRKVTMVA